MTCLPRSGDGPPLPPAGADLAPPDGRAFDAAGRDRLLARLSADEMVAALGLGSAPSPVRVAVRAGFFAFSRPLAHVLARFDARIPSLGLAAAARAALSDLGATCRREGPEPPPRGALLVVSNHPGAYDTLSLIAAVGRDDLALVAADRAFLRALPAFAERLLFVPDVATGAALERARGLRRALAHLARGGAMLHFGAGRIEPDPAFPRPPGAEPLATWSKGTGVLVRGAARVHGTVTAAIVEGVHSPAAKRSWATKMAERRGVTTLAPLLQLSFRRYRTVNATVRFGAPLDARELSRAADDAIITAAVRDAARALLAPPPLA